MFIGLLFCYPFGNLSKKSTEFSFMFYLFHTEPSLSASFNCFSLSQSTFSRHDCSWACRPKYQAIYVIRATVSNVLSNMVGGLEDEYFYRQHIWNGIV